jgi:hypothetical protein
VYSNRKKKVRCQKFAARTPAYTRIVKPDAAKKSKKKTRQRIPDFLRASFLCAFSDLAFLLRTYIQTQMTDLDMRTGAIEINQSFIFFFFFL